MKKLVISGSAKLHERALYWRGYFEGRGYEVIDWPAPVSDEEETLDEPQAAPGLSLGRWLKSGDADYAERLKKVYQRFYKNLDQADVLFVMNEDKNGIEGYIGPCVFAELTYVLMANMNRGHQTEIQLLQMPSKEQGCYEEVKFWLDQKMIKLYQRPVGRKASIPVPDVPSVMEKRANIVTKVAPIVASQPIHDPDPEDLVFEDEEETGKTGLFRKQEKTLDVLLCNKKCLKTISPAWREYLKMLSPEFPTWLLKYIAAPEMQRLSGISTTCGLDYTALYEYKTFNSVLAHSIGTALIVWRFTKDKKQTLAGLFHDIATPVFKHAIDYMNDDSKVQESTEARTLSIIQESRTIMHLLKKDGIAVSEVADYHLYPIADNEMPQLAADRLEYTLSNGLFLYDTWDLDQVREFYQNLMVVENEDGASEIGFRSPEIAAKFTLENLPLTSVYHGEKSRVNMEFLSDVVKTMLTRELITESDLYSMNERDFIDWILGCGDHEISEAFRKYQRTTSVYTGNTPKKGVYCASKEPKIRYIVPLTLTGKTNKNGQLVVRRVTEVNEETDVAIKKFLAEKLPKYVGLDFEFKPQEKA